MLLIEIFLTSLDFYKSKYHNMVLIKVDSCKIPKYHVKNITVVMIILINTGYPINVINKHNSRKIRRM